MSPTLAQLQPAALPDLPEGPSLDRVRGPVEPPAPALWQLWVLGLLGLLAFVAIIWLVRRLRRKAPRTVPAPPAATAREALAAARLTDDPRLQASLCGGILRAYLERRFNLPAGRITPREVPDLAELPEALKAPVAGILESAERVQFAPVGDAPVEAAGQIVEAGEACIETCEKALATPAEREGGR